MSPRLPRLLVLLGLAFFGDSLAQTITDHGIDAEGNPSITFQTTAGESYVYRQEAKALVADFLLN